jgi:hypothetical protein
MLSVIIHRQPGYALRESILNKPNADRFRSLAAFHHIDSDPLALYQFGNAGPVQRRDMDENVFAAAILVGSAHAAHWLSRIVRQKRVWQWPVDG